MLASADWHQGVVGIVASRLSEEYGCPACLICLDGESGKASCRSYGGFPLIDALHRLSPLLERYGGHQLAAGFTIRAGQIDAFRQALTELVRGYRAGGAPPASIRLDCRVTDPALLTLSQVEALQALEPCGAECPRPMICVSGLTVLQAAEVGGGKHLRLRLRLGDEELGGIFFSTTALRAGVAPGDVIEAACMPQVNEFRGLRSVQLQLTDLRLMEPERTACEAARQLYQRHRSGEPLTQPDAAAQRVCRRVALSEGALPGRRAARAGRLSLPQDCPQRGPARQLCAHADLPGRVSGVRPAVGVPPAGAV